MILRNVSTIGSLPEILSVVATGAPLVIILASLWLIRHDPVITVADASAIHVVKPLQVDDAYIKGFATLAAQRRLSWTIDGAGASNGLLQSMCRGAAISRAQTDGTYINSLVRMFLATAMCRVFDVKITKVEADVPYWDVTVYVYQERYDGPILRDIRPVIMRMSVIQVIPENGREYALAILDYGVQIGSPVRRGSDPGGLGFAFEVEGESVESATQAPTPSATAPSMTPDLTPSTSRASVAL